MAWVKRILIAVVALLVLGMVVYGFVPKPLGVDLVTVASGPLSVTVDDDGRTRVRDRYTLSVPVAGELQRIALKAGDNVKAGDVVARLLPAPPQLLDVRSRPQLEARVLGADAALKQAGARKDAAVAARVIADLENKRQVKLEGTTGYSKELADRAAQQLAIAEAEVRSADFAAKVAEYDLEAARAALAGGVGDAPVELKSPVDGRVLRVFEESARTVLAGTPLIEVGDPHALEIVVDLLSSEAVKIPAEAKVRVERWGGEKPLAARVRRVEPSGFTKISALGVEEQRVNVLIDITEPHDNWRSLGDGFAVEARIVLWEAAKTLKAPLGAVFREGEGWAVFVAVNGKAELRPVKLGMRNGSDAQILAGLSEGETVVLHPGDTVKHGVAVVAR
ncbi:MAG: efflux RND transporter periplasmic adaptor subunit [Planctomycetes bacterium]|nr:efflux RND transporter periplasmic adaptor subunit [Planctomycetota bacterium]